MKMGKVRYPKFFIGIHIWMSYLDLICGRPQGLGCPTKSIAVVAAGPNKRRILNRTVGGVKFAAFMQAMG